MTVIKIDADGKVLLPAEVRRQLKLDEGEELMVDKSKDGTIILEKIERQKLFERWLNNISLK